MGFGFGDPGKNIDAPLLYPVAEGGVFYQGADIPPGIMAGVIVGMPVGAVMIVRMIMVVAVVMRVIRGMAVVVRMIVMMTVVMLMIMRMAMPVARINYRPDAADAAAIVPDKIQLPAVEVQFVQFAF
jgi:hypothetical protein